MVRAIFDVLGFTIIPFGNYFKALCVPSDLLIHAITMKSGGRMELRSRRHPKSVDQWVANQ